MTLAIGIIPARWGSTRLEGKSLANIAGKPMIQHVYERASQAPSLQQIIVATDDLRIIEAVKSFGGEARMTRTDHPSGTDRIAEIARELEANIIVNIQGDEPLIDPNNIESAIKPLISDNTIPMGTLRTKIINDKDYADSSVVKVVTDRLGFALYFSRYPIPFIRDAENTITHYRHIGLYTYQRDFLLKFSTLSPTPLEKAESLEQLRALEHGYRIMVSEVSGAAGGVDTPEQLEQVRSIMEQGRCK